MLRKPLSALYYTVVVVYGSYTLYCCTVSDARSVQMLCVGYVLYRALVEFALDYASMISLDTVF